MSSLNKTKGGRRAKGTQNLRKTKRTGGSGLSELTPASVTGGSASKPVIHGGNNKQPVHGGNDIDADLDTLKSVTESMAQGGDAKETDENANKVSLYGGEHEKPIAKGGKKSGAACGKAYCVKCKKNNMAMTNCRNVTSKNGRTMLKGLCKKCGTKMNKFT